MGDPLDDHVQARPENEVCDSKPWEGLEKQRSRVTTDPHGFANSNERLFHPNFTYQGV